MLLRIGDAVVKMKDDKKLKEMLGERRRGGEHNHEDVRAK